MDKAEPAETLSQRGEELLTSVTFNAFCYVTRGLFERHRLIFSLQLACRILINAQQLSPELVEHLVRGPRAPSAHNPCASWLPDAAWQAVGGLSLSCEPFASLAKDVEGSAKRWKEWCETYPTPELPHPYHTPFHTPFPHTLSTPVPHRYVVEDPSSKQITDMVSFYSLPSSILGHDKHKTLYAAYSYYYFHTATPLLQLVNDAMIHAKRLEFDVFNALDVLQNDQYLKDLKFGIGDGNLQYYLFNWRAPFVKPGEVGLVLL